MIKRKILSIIGSIFSLLGIIGIILSNAILEIFLFLITALSGLFTLAVGWQKK